MRRDPRWPQLALCAGLSLFTVFAGFVTAGHASLALLVGLGLWVFGIFFAGLYRDEILPIVGEKLLVSFTLIFWYGFAAEFYHGTRLQQVLLVVSLLPSAATLYVAWARPVLASWSRLTLYAWYLLIVVFLGWLQFPFGNLSIFAGGSGRGWLGPIDAFATGMASLYLLANAFYLYLLLPIPGNGQSFSDRMRQWHDLTHLMTQRCSDQDGPSHGQALAIVGVLAAGLLVNYAFALLPYSLMISVAIVASALLLERPSVRLALSGSAESAAND